LNFIKVLSILAILIITIIWVNPNAMSNSWQYVSLDEPLKEIVANSSNKILSLENGIHHGPLTLIHCNNVTIKPFSGTATIECSGADAGINIIGGSNITIEDLSLNNSNNGIKVEGARSCNLINNYINFKNGAGITIDGVSRSTIAGNTIKNDNIGKFLSNGIEVYYSIGNFISENSFVLQGNGTFILLDHSFNNSINLNQCGIIVDNLNECKCAAEGCYKCGRESQLNNSWNLNPNFCLN
jgi:nitrous oxidase accessory protein NosD